VEEPGPRGIELVLLQDRVVGLLGAVQHDVEDGVQPVVAGKHAPELALLDGEGLGIAPVAVEDAWDETLGTQTPRGRASARLPRLHLQLDALAGHIRLPSVAKRSLTSPQPAA
jgi:hypothetical protein